MAQNGATPQTDKLGLSDSDTEDLFASPSIKNEKRQKQKIKADSSSREPPNDPAYDSEETREAALRKELAGIRSINQVIAGVSDSLEKAQGNMQAVSGTVNNATALLATWTRILSQTEHNQRLILDPSWQGASADVAEMENESLLKQQEKERRELEDGRRREETARRAEEEERRRAEAAIMSTRGGRGSRARGRGLSARGSTPSGYTGVGGQSGTRGSARGGNVTPGRSSSGIGRGIARGRVRGTGRG